MVLLKVVDKLCNSSVCGTHSISHDLLYNLLVDIELYLIISCISHLLVDDNWVLKYELVRFIYFDLQFKHILRNLEFERRKIMWFVTINNQAFMGYMALKTFLKLVNTNWNQVTQLTYRVTKLIIIFFLATIAPPK